MINLGVVFVGIAGLAVLLWIWRRKLWSATWMMWIFVISILLSQLATQTGWWTAEFGRQPWIVWELLRTADAESPNVSALQVGLSVGMFVILYSLLFVVFLYLLNKVIQKGPQPPDEEGTVTSLPDSFGEIFGRRSRVSETREPVESR
jgi:cytochrome d ubiquinol oxidase subunit I